MKLFSTSQFVPLVACACIGNAFAGSPAPVMAPPAPAGCDAGWTLGLEAMALRPFQDSGSYRESDFNFGGRISLGYQFDDCLFTRLTYFGYSADGEAGSALLGLTGDADAVDSFTYDLDMSYWDLVIGDTFHPTEKLTIAASVGLRQASFEESLIIAGDDVDGTVSADFDGLGIVVGVDVKRKLTDTLSFYLTGKQSIVFGKRDLSFVGDAAVDDENLATRQDNSVVAITELGGGIQYDFAFSGVDANIRAGVEGQYWADPALGGPSELAFISKSASGVAGFVLGANFRF